MKADAIVAPQQAEEDTTTVAQMQPTAAGDAASTQTAEASHQPDGTSTQPAAASVQPAIAAATAAADADKWVLVSRQPNLETYFLKEVAGKGTAQATVVMLTNFKTPQPVQGSDLSFRSASFRIRIDCKAATGGPDLVTKTSEPFLQGDTVNQEQRAPNPKTFQPTDPMYLMACN